MHRAGFPIKETDHEEHFLPPAAPVGDGHRAGFGLAGGGPRVGALYAGTLATIAALWVPPLFGGILILGLVGTLVRFSPRFRAYDALDPQP